MAFLRYFCRLILCVLLATPVPAAHAADNLELHEQEIKAGLLYNFLKYTDWPADKTAGSSVVVCVFGDNPFGGYLQPMAGRTVNQREIVLNTIREMRDVEKCHLLFVNASEKDRWPQLLKFLDSKSVLTVSDFAGFADSGGMIEFGHKDNHISAVLNINATDNA